MNSDTGGWWSLKSGRLLPYGVFVAPGLEQPRVGVAVGATVLDLTAASTALLPEHAELFRGGNLDALLGAGRKIWTVLRAALIHWLAEEREVLESMCRPASAVTMRLPFTVADYVDFYSSEHHAANVGRMFRPGQPALPANWRHLPVAYHGRAGTVVVSGTPVTRPFGPRREAGGTICFGPSTALDFEAEVGFVVGTPSTRPVPLAGFADHVFGLCLVNDWSARDIQRWESTPLGPFLGKSFATSISPWIVPLDALSAARVPPPVRDPRPLPYLDDTGAPAWALDLTLEVRLNGHLISRPPFAGMYWTAAQQLAHLTVNGAILRTGDLFASGTVSGPEPAQRGSLLELSWNGRHPVTLPDGTTRDFLADGDEVSITATAPAGNGETVQLGEVRGRITANPRAVDGPARR